MKDKLLRVLKNAQNPDGGWGYFVGKQSALEPTSFALMALLCSDFGSPSLLSGYQFLRDRQLECGGWTVNVVAPEPEAWVTALAGIALYSKDGLSPGCRKSAEFVLSSFAMMPVDWLTRFKTSLGFSPPFNVDYRLRGWGWTPQTAKWLEPTCNALILLNKVRSQMNSHGLDEVVAEAEQMAYDRMCRGGGWNYGNAQVLGEQLRPYPSTTSLALIALQNHASRPENQRSLEYLVQSVGEEKSALSLCLACLCLDLYSRKYQELEARLQTLYEETCFFGNIKTTALALLVLAGNNRTNPLRYAST